MSKSNGTTKEITPDEARRILQESDQKTAQAFLDEMQAVCTKYNAELIATAFIMPDGRVGADISHFSINGRVMEIGRHG